MPRTYSKAPPEAVEILGAVMCEHECYQALLDAKVKIDLVFAHPPLDDDGKVCGDAITHQGHKALGLARIIDLKDRAKGNGDAEILIDADWYENAHTKEVRALFDHELYHIQAKCNKAGIAHRDDLGRPKLKMRKHDVQVGWFSVVAKRNGEHSMEQQQAKAIMDKLGQAFWPEMAR